MGIFDIVGFDGSWKVPKFGGQVLFGQGAVSAASLQTLVLLVGMRLAGATSPLVLDTEAREVFSEADAIAASGQGSQLHRQYRAASRVPNRRIFMAAVTEPGGGTAATGTFTPTGSWTTAGQITLYCGDESIVVPVNVSDTVDTFGAAVATAWNAKANLPVTFSYNGGTHVGTWTHRHKGTQGTDQGIVLDMSKAPAGLNIALLGSLALSGNGYTGILLGNGGTGTGSEDLTTLLTSPQIKNKRYARIAIAANDATNAQRMQTFVKSQAGPTILLLEQFVVGTNKTQGTATTLAQTNLNEPRAQVVATRNYRMHPSECAAVVAAIRAGVEGASKYQVPDYDFYDIPAFPAQLILGDQWSSTEQNALLNAGVTPLDTVDSTLNIVRGVTTYCLNASVQDERCIDIGDATTADYVMLDLQLHYNTSFRVANPVVRDKAQPGEKIPTGVATPDMWTTAMLRKMVGYRDGTSSNGPIITDSFSSLADPSIFNPPSSEFNRPTQAIQSQMTIYPLRVQHKLSTKVVQSAALS